MENLDPTFELESLSQAVRYQEWVYELIEPYLGKRILEIGAGIGNMSRWFPIRERLILSETDPTLIERLKQSPHGVKWASDSRVSVVSLDVMSDRLFTLTPENLDTVISFNVLEHIENDQLALEKLVRLLQQSSAERKRLITFVPAHPWAYGGMDRTFGHFRRYPRGRIEQCIREVEPSAKIHSEFFNTVGLMGWIMNGKILRKRQIGTGAIQTFEKICPWIKPVDRWLHQGLHLPLGQSLLVVAEWGE